MKYTVGIDLGSTTTKAVVLGDRGETLGRGITNSRSNYGVACEVALIEALIGARFGLVEQEVAKFEQDEGRRSLWLTQLQENLRLEQYLGQLESLAAVLAREAESTGLESTVAETADALTSEAPDLYAPGTTRKSDFFRDLAGSRYRSLAEQAAKELAGTFDILVGLFDKSILEVENSPAASGEFSTYARAALKRMTDVPEDLEGAVEKAIDIPLELAISVGTGYGRATLPFPKEQIRSEILCHGLGAHAMFPDTRTVLDIGGQDTKAIQVDEQGIVTSFQMNDRCAAGCGRYLGYIADEMNLGLHELGPLAQESTRTVRINSTCTVFAGAELRERLSLGERREDILAGLHRAVILRAMALLARSGGVSDQFTFTGGVAKNPAAVEALRQLTEENYDGPTLNISPDSIYLFARRDWQRSLDGGGPMSAEPDKTLTVAGVDLGSSAVKIVLFRDRPGESGELFLGRSERLRRRDPLEVTEELFDACLEESGLGRGDLAYVATTGEGEGVAFRTGHFYGMTTHARGGLFLDPEARTVLDIGALHTRAVRMDARAKVLSYRMTSQCASGSGQFLENICRYLGTTIADVGPLSLEADNPEPCSSICAVLAETDVINMVSRGITTPNIIRGIHDSMAGRYLRLLTSAGAEGRVLVTGGLSADVGLLAALADGAERADARFTIHTHDRAVLAGALGAAIWGAFRVRRLRAKGLDLAVETEAA